MIPLAFANLERGDSTVEESKCAGRDDESAERVAVAVTGGDQDCRSDERVPSSVYGA